MDISLYTVELLYKHDCVIIPGFGGFVCSYQPAVINTGRNTISPPSKMVSFNRSLQTNDGLLANYISAQTGLTFAEVCDHIAAWVNFSNTLLTANEKVNLNRIGSFYKDDEGNLQFEVNDVNFLKSSYGLRTITVEPVIKKKEETVVRKIRLRKPGRILSPTAWRMAAAVLLVACISSLATMMWMGVNVQPLKLDEANTIGFVNRIFKTEEHVAKLVPVETETTPDIQPATDIVNQEVTTPTANTPPPVPTEEPVAQPQPIVVEKPVPTITGNGQSVYYIIIGAFKDEQNAANAKTKLLQKFPEENILFEKHGTLTKVGYYAGNNAAIAKEELNSAHAEDGSYWLLKK